MSIKRGWRFYSADFSMQSNGLAEEGVVTLVRDSAGRAAWSKMEESVRLDDEGPPLFVHGRGVTVEKAIVDANITATHAKPISGD